MTAKHLLKANYLVSGMIVILVILCGVIALISGPYHNPDANLYYQVTIRLLNGNESSVNGFIGPLLSWLMTVPAWFGVNLPYSFRIVQFAAFVVLLLSASRFADLFELPTLPKLAFLALLAAQAMPNTVFVITSDILAAALFSLCTYLLIRDPVMISIRDCVFVGILGGLAFLAKTIELPIFILSALTVLLVQASRSGKFSKALGRGLVISAALTATVTPWLCALYTKYHTFTIGMNHLGLLGLIDENELTINSAIAQVQGIASGATGTLNIGLLQFLHNVFEVIANAQANFEISCAYLWPEVTYAFGDSAMLVSYIVIIAFALLPFAPMNKLRSKTTLLGILTLIHFVVYCSVWGGRMRYHLPVTINLNILFFCAVTEFYKHWSLSMSRLLKLGRFALLGLATIVYISIMSMAFHYIWVFSHKMSWDIAYKIADNKYLASNNSYIAGMEKDPYYGLVAALLKREVPSYLHQSEETDEAITAHRLIDWQIGQILWIGPHWTILDRIPGVSLVDKFNIGEIPVEIYNVKVLPRVSS